MGQLQAPATSIGNKGNKPLMILSALGILFVVDEHLGRPISFLHQFFPYDSFYMPLFMFVSGYFFSTKYCVSFRDALGFVWKRTKKALLPYIFWVVFYGLFTSILTRLHIIEFQLPKTFSEIFLQCATNGSSFGYNSPSWFVPTLFAVSVIYCCCRTLFRKIWNDTAALIVMIGIGAAAVYASNTAFNTTRNLMLLKVAFFAQFYHLGYYFKLYLEKFFDKINTYIVCATTICINVVLLYIYAYHIRFPNCARMGGFFTDNVFLPLITTVTAVAFWLKISKNLAPTFGENKLVNFISDNTFFIMTHHLTARALFNGLLILGKKAGMTAFAAIDVAKFKSSAWYTFNGAPWLNTLCFIFTMAVTLLACLAYLRLKKYCFAGIKYLAAKRK